MAMARWEATNGRLAAPPVVHRIEARTFPVNAYLVETERGLVAVDSLLTVSDARALRVRAVGLGKPLLAVLITHAHPDHYGGLTELLAGRDVPVYATPGVAQAIVRDDPAKEAVLRPMFGDEWPRRRTFPNRSVGDGDVLTLDGVRFRVMDLGPGESPHDSIWILEDGAPRAFVGDVVYNRLHAYLADGHHQAWLGTLDRLRAVFEPGTVFYPGHGEPASPALLEWQSGYLHAFLDAVRDAGPGEDAVPQVTQRVQTYLPGDQLLFLMQLSVAPVRAGLFHPTNSESEGYQS